MTPIIDFMIMEDPQSKQRPRVVNGHGYTPKKTRDAEQRVRDEYLAHYGHLPLLEGPISIQIDYYMGTRIGRDWDNLAKLTTDALNGIAYKDDKQIIHAQIRKYLPDDMVPNRKGVLRPRNSNDPLTYLSIPYQPHTHIKIFDLTGQELTVMHREQHMYPTND